jgi:predicted nucleic acid-binding Zn ribbon protein
MIFKGSGFYITDYKNNRSSAQKKKPETKKENEKSTSKAS